MSDQPLISVPILTYNGEKYLREQLDSIYSQTYKNIEVLAFDDCSKDGTTAILQEYHLSHGLTYFINEKNLGFQKNAAQSLLSCTGDYIAPADQDDIWKIDKLEKLVTNIGDNVLIYSDSIPIDEHGNKLANNFVQQVRNLVDGSNNKNFFFENCISAHAMLFKRELLTYALPIPDEMFYHDWWIAFVASTYGSIKLIDEPLVYYRRHQAQVTLQKEKNYQGFFSRIKFREHRLKNSKLNTLKNLRCFATLTILDNETKKLLDQLIIHLENFSTVYFDKELEAILLEHKEDFFAMNLDRDLDKAAKKFARGLWYYRLKLYT